METRALQEARKDVAILLANGRADDKLRLGISNQDYPSFREMATVRVLSSRVRLEAAEEFIRITSRNRLYAEGLENEFEHFAEKHQAEVLGK